MTLSDDNLSRDPSCESNCLGTNKFSMQRSVTDFEAGENEIRRGEAPECSSEGTKLGCKGCPGLINSVGMGSTDSAGNTHSGGSSCGFVSSLFPNSCRGRAESFARRLHRRLTSLGGEGVDASEDEEDESMKFLSKGGAKKVSENSWLQGSTGQRTVTTLPINASGLSCPEQMDERVLDSQPRHSPESDVYYDFDFEPHENSSRVNADGNDEYASNSPAEIATDSDVASIILNRKIKRFDNRENRNVGQENSRYPEYFEDSESGCIYASPLPGTSPDTDTSELFFDPESSETEKTCESVEENDTTYDTIKGSESETLASEIDSDKQSISCKTQRHPLRRKNHRIVEADKHREDNNHRDNDDDDDDDDNNTSESSSSFCNPDVAGANSTSPETRFTASSEESLNGNKSSIETTTSQSHESLWSTFDDNTISNQEETSTVSPASNSPGQATTMAKSHSDSEIDGKSSRSNEIDAVDCAESMFPLTNGDDIEDFRNIENNESSYLSSIDIPGDLVVECPSNVTIVTPEENLKNRVNDLRTEDVRDCDVDMSRLLERLASSPHIDKIDATIDPSNRHDQEEEENTTNGRRTNDDKDDEIEAEDAEVHCEKTNESADKNEKEEEDDEEKEENNRPQRLRRCSSLKTGKTPPGTPCRKKIVRFADVLGLDLADVRTFLDEIPKIPNSAYSDLMYDEAFQKDSSPVNVWCQRSSNFTAPFNATLISRGNPNVIKHDGILVPLFQQPGGSMTFLDKVRERQVCLENILIEDPANMCIRGTVRVRNLDFHKSVHIRYTLDSWRNYSDLQATYVSNSCDGFSDKFTFILYCHTLKIGQRLELAVRFQCKGSQYWDNNSGINYCIQCLSATTTNPGYIPITIPTTMRATALPTSHHDWSPTFY